MHATPEMPACLSIYLPNPHQNDDDDDDYASHDDGDDNGDRRVVNANVINVSGSLSLYPL